MQQLVISTRPALISAISVNVGAYFSAAPSLRFAMSLGETDFLTALALADADDLVATLQVAQRWNQSALGSADIPNGLEQRVLCGDLLLEDANKTSSLHFAGWCLPSFLIPLIPVPGAKADALV